MGSHVKFGSILILSAIAICCTSQKVAHSNISSNVVLVDLGHVSRVELAGLVATISKCNPKIIAINAIFDSSYLNAGETKILASSFRNAGNIVLASDITPHAKLRTGDSTLIKSALAQGLVSLGSNDRQEITSFSTYSSVDGTSLWSFATAVVSEFDIDEMEAIMQLARGSTYYDIDFDDIPYLSDTISKAKILEDCLRIQNKIVLVGYLGRNDEDQYYTARDKEKKIHSTLILACVIENLFNHKFSPTK